MKMVKSFYFSLLTGIGALWTAVPLYIAGQPFQSDTLLVAHVTAPPLIDGDSTDQCWDSTGWEPINQVWIPWGGTMEPADFQGRYKVLWSSGENLLYFLAEITDDAYVDGYVYSSIPGAGNNYPDYDVLEVFIDENATKGKHVFDAPTQTGFENAENALAYHIMVSGPEEGGTVTDIDVCDIAGESWSDYWIPNFNTHLPEFALKKTDGKYFWEFSLKVYGDNLDPADPSDDDLVDLYSGKIMGLSLAYCDNDEAGTGRDNFIGSVWVPEERYNDHWMDAGDFRAAMLQGLVIPTLDADRDAEVLHACYDPVSRKLHIEPLSTPGYAAVYNMNGTLVGRMAWTCGPQNSLSGVSFENLPDGIYLLRSVTDAGHGVSKICIY